MVFNKEEFSELLNLAKGKRSINKYGIDSCVDPGYISRLLRCKIDNSPSANIIKKFANNAHNGVTYEQLMESAGYLDRKDEDSSSNKSEKTLTLESLNEELKKNNIDIFASGGFEDFYDLEPEEQEFIIQSVKNSIEMFKKKKEQNK